MDFIDELGALAARIENQKKHTQTEEATKTAFVLPFISALGYNVFDPTEVIPELTADVGVKKGEKVDYAILKGGKPVMLVECKHWGTNLDTVSASQLYRYFSVTEARIGILTNGILYRFFSDLDEPNKMDEKPFLEVDLLDLREPQVQELKRLRKASFDLEEVVSTAGELKYTKEVRRIFAENVSDPSEEFVRFFAGQVHSGRITKNIVDRFSEFVKRAINQYITDRISDRLRSALDQESAQQATEGEPTPKESPEAQERQAYGKEGEGDGVVTTEDEWRGYYIVSAILSEVTSPERVFMRDSKTYCAVILDDNNRKPICRLWFNRAQYYLGLFDEAKHEERVPIDGVGDIYKHGEHLKKMVAFYDAPDEAARAEG